MISGAARAYSPSVNAINSDDVAERIYGWLNQSGDAFSRFQRSTSFGESLRHSLAGFATARRDRGERRHLTTAGSDRLDQPSS
jgi:hypothetical protein